MNFDSSFELLIGSEGGFTKDPRDRGNWDSGRIYIGTLKGTKYGISAAQYPLENIADLTIDRSKQLYKRDYWDKLNCDQMPTTIAFDMFDMAVNSGVKTAALILQKTVHSFEDGVIGEQTIKAITAMDMQLLDKRLSANRLLYLCSLDSFPTYGKGWVRRVANNLLMD